MIVRSLADSGLARRLESELLRAKASSGSHARADVWLAELALAHNRVPEAVRLLEEAERIAPDTPRLAIAQGRAYQAAGDPAKSRAAYERALGQPDEADEARMMIDRPAGP
jgi:Flp pilus assembly protein TadD